MRCLELRRPAAEVGGLLGEIRIPARVALVARQGRGVGAAEVGEIPVAAVDEHERRRPLGEAGGERAADLGADREAEEARPAGDELRGERGEARRQVVVERQGGRAAVAGRVRREHVEAVVAREERPDLVRVQAGAAETVPVEQRPPAPVAPLVEMHYSR